MFHLDSVSEDEEKALGTSEDEDDLEPNVEVNGIWERRRSGVIKNKRSVKNKENVEARQS